MIIERRRRRRRRRKRIGMRTNGREEDFDVSDETNWLTETRHWRGGHGNSWQNMKMTEIDQRGRKRCWLFSASAVERRNSGWQERVASLLSGDDLVVSWFNICQKLIFSNKMTYVMTSIFFPNEDEGNDVRLESLMVIIRRGSACCQRLAFVQMRWETSRRNSKWQL